MRYGMGREKVAIAKGNGIGPEIMDAVLAILEAATSDLEYHPIEIGEKVYLEGHASGITPASWKTLQECPVFLKAPITTPQGKGFRSVNVAIRSALGLYANVRPCVAFAPYIKTRHPQMDVVIIRENEEDLYAGIEYRPTIETCHATKVITQKGCEKIIHYAFRYAEKYKRKKISCFAKDNILKLSDGMFVKIFHEIAALYPHLEADTWNVDIGAAKLADVPHTFDVIVMPNLYGDILSDVAAQIAGSVGLAGSSNIGRHHSMFEAIHGSAPKRAGQNIANPSGLLHAAIMMLVHLGNTKTAELINNAWLKTIEDGIHTYDIYEEGKSIKKVGTNEFAQAIIERLGKNPSILKKAQYEEVQTSAQVASLEEKKEIKHLDGVDIYIDGHFQPDVLHQKLKELLIDTPCTLEFITSRGATFYPAHYCESEASDLWRVRLLGKHAQEITPYDIIHIQKLLLDHNFIITSVENLYKFNESLGYSII